MIAASCQKLCHTICGCGVAPSRMVASYLESCHAVCARGVVPYEIAGSYHAAWSHRTRSCVKPIVLVRSRHARSRVVPYVLAGLCHAEGCATPCAWIAACLVWHRAQGRTMPGHACLPCTHRWSTSPTAARAHRTLAALRTPQSTSPKASPSGPLSSCWACCPPPAAACCPPHTSPSWRTRPRPSLTSTPSHLRCVITHGLWWKAGPTAKVHALHKCAVMLRGSGSCLTSCT